MRTTDLLEAIIDIANKQHTHTSHNTCQCIRVGRQERKVHFPTGEDARCQCLYLDSARPKQYIFVCYRWHIALFKLHIQLAKHISVSDASICPSSAASSFASASAASFCSLSASYLRSPHLGPPQFQWYGRLPHHLHFMEKFEAKHEEFLQI